MACRLFGTKPLSETILYHCQMDPCDSLRTNFSHIVFQIQAFFIQENAFENAWTMSAILSQCVISITWSPPDIGGCVTMSGSLGLCHQMVIRDKTQQVIMIMIHIVL